MAEKRSRQLIAAEAIIHDTPPVRLATTVDRSFELPAAVYVATAGAYFAFLGIMALGFGNPGLIVPMGIFVIFVGMFFAVPAVWMRMKPANPQRLTTYGRFLEDGIMTAYGHTPAVAAMAQILILPALIVAWGITVVTIAALVR